MDPEPKNYGVSSEKSAAALEEGREPHYGVSEKSVAALEEGRGLLEPLLGKIEAEVVPIRERLASLDIFRGLTIAIMIMVDGLGESWPAIDHAPWNGVQLADVVMPAFLFMVGFSISLAFKRVSKREAASSKAILRTLKLCIIGILLQGGYYHMNGPRYLSLWVDIRMIRWCGILQRIGFAYIVVTLCEIWNPRMSAISLPDGSYAILKMYARHWIVAGLLSGVYLLLLYGLYVPDWEFVPQSTRSQTVSALKVKCGVRGDMGPACNAVGYVDRLLLGINHCFQDATYRGTKACSSIDYSGSADPVLPSGSPNWCLAPFEPEGLVSSLSAIVTCFIGLHFGHTLVHMKGHSLRVKHWTLTAVGLVAVGFTLHFLGMPINKPLYTLSYAYVTAGGAGLVFVAIYVLVDVYGIWWPTLFLQWMGMNSLLIFVLVASRVADAILRGFYWQYPENNVVVFYEMLLYKALFSSLVLSKVVVSLCKIVLWSGVAGALHAKKIYFKL